MQELCMYLEANNIDYFVTIDFWTSYYMLSVYPRNATKYIKDSAFNHLLYNVAYEDDNGSICFEYLF